MAETNVAEFAGWAGAVSGKLGRAADGSFLVIDAGIQIFEKKPKEVKVEVGAAVSQAAVSS